MTAQFPEKLAFLFEPARFKVAYGGRDGSKSWGFARALLIMGAQRKLFIVCGRELMNSIKESVHRVLSNQIVNLGLEDRYQVEKAKIIGSNGTEFVFVGLKNNPDAIKSLEGADILWVEEAANVSKASWSMVTPTVRKKDSEIWISFNPKLEADETYQRFVVNPPPGARVAKILYTDNPWASEVLRAEREDLEKRDPDAYAHIWLGHPARMVEGAIYANELRAAENEGRIRRVAYDPLKPVHCAWDLGEGDATAIWFFQVFMAEYRFIDYYENSGQKMQFYLSLLQGKGYVYGTDYLPWDACSGMLSGSLEQAMRTAGRSIRILPKLPVASRIDTARTIFANCWFDAEKTADGLNRLRYYRYGEVKDMGTATRAPQHDAASHGADAFGYAGQGIVLPKRDAKTPPPAVQRARTPPPTAWS
ncbi:MAG: PBSX family phage terminase large subunit [Candidatus Eremiobacteraeota bacterium]|nr:PBSX family phage terminase large subunit [Candidatus Eremiobacteraeota bacterium]